MPTTDPDSSLNTRPLAVYMLVLSKRIQELPADSTDAADLNLLRTALEGMKSCISYRPIKRSEDGERAWLHDFRNHVNAVKGYAELCRETGSEAMVELDELLESILGASSTWLDDVDTQRRNLIGSMSSGSTRQPLGNILVVEDQYDSRRMLCELLQQRGHSVTEADTGGGAMQALEALSPDIVLLDLLLPDMHGHDLLNKLKRDASLRDIPVIMISGYQDTDEVIRCIEDGAEDYLYKPVNQIMLHARINASLERKAWRDREQAFLHELANSHAFIRNTFGRYTSDEIVEQLLEDPHGLELGGKLQRATVMMADICGFTSLCEMLRPDQVVQVLNNYLGSLSDVILDHGGTIDEFLGDAILAIFGVPLRNEDDADRAIACAKAMQAKMVEINAKNASMGLPAIKSCIALNTGDVIAGNIGSEKRSKYGIVGQPVNIAARVESYAGPDEILLTQATREALKAPVALGASTRLDAKGIDEPLTIYKVEY